MSHEPGAFRQTMQKYTIRQNSLSASGSSYEILTKKAPIESVDDITNYVTHAAVL